MLDRHSDAHATAETQRALDRGIADRQGLLRFLAHRQFPYLSKKEEKDEGTVENYLEAKLGDLKLDGGYPYMGYNGRWNKKADTCYTWWACSTLKVSPTAREASFLLSYGMLADNTDDLVCF